MGRLRQMMTVEPIEAESKTLNSSLTQREALSLPSLVALFDACDDTQRDAEHCISAERRQEHRQLSVHTKAAWEALSVKYPDELTLELLSLIADFRTKLTGLQLRANADCHPPDLRLTKCRSGVFGHGK